MYYLFAHTNHQIPLFERQVVRGKDSAVVMASQIEDDVAPRRVPQIEVKNTEWKQEQAAAGRKLDLVPSYEDILDSISYSSQSSLLSQRISPPRSPSVISQSQPVRSRKVRLPYFNTQKTSAVIDLDELDDVVDAKHLRLHSSVDKASTQAKDETYG